jgi:hypothetical protein
MASLNTELRRQVIAIYKGSLHNSLFLHYGLALKPSAFITRPSHLVSKRQKFSISSSIVAIFPSDQKKTQLLLNLIYAY